MTLTEGQVEEYETRHREIWPEMLEAITRCGYTNYTLFRAGQTVVGYAECVPNVETAASLMNAEPVTARWNESFQGVIEVAPATGGFSIPLTSIWHLE